jgi:hypothetical protein
MERCAVSPNSLQDKITQEMDEGVTNPRQYCEFIQPNYSLLIKLYSIRGVILEEFIINPLIEKLLQ